MPRANHEEYYVTRTWLTKMSGINYTELEDLLHKYGVENNKVQNGYPLSVIIRILNDERRTKSKRRSINLAELEEVKKQEEIIKLQLQNGEKNGTLIKRTYAKERVRATFQAVTSKIRYAIKQISPRMVGIDSARVIEEMLTKGWNGAIQLLEEQSTCSDWETDNPSVELSDTKPITQYVEVRDTCSNSDSLESLSRGGANFETSYSETLER